VQPTGQEAAADRTGSCCRGTGSCGRPDRKLQPTGQEASADRTGSFSRPDRKLQPTGQEAAVEEQEAAADRTGRGSCRMRLAVEEASVFSSFAR